MVELDCGLTHYVDEVNCDAHLNRTSSKKNVTGRPAPTTILAGDRYREFLTPMLQARGVQVDVPMQGLRIGEQLRWLDRPR